MPSVFRGGAGDWRGAATGVLLFVGALASVAGLLGTTDAWLSPSLSAVGVAATLALAGSAGAAALRSRRDSAPPREAGDPAAGADTPLELYQAEGCPYCATVRRFCTRHGISLVVHNPRTAGTSLTAGTVTNRARHGDLTAHGRDQIPLLVDDARGKALYESDDVVAYLREHYC